MITPRTTILLFCLALSLQAVSQNSNDVWKFNDQSYSLEWGLKDDRARMIHSSAGQSLWSGGLFPAFWVKDSKGTYLYLKAEFVALTEIDSRQSRLDLRITGWAEGSLIIEKNEWGILFSELKIVWNDEIPSIIEMFWGTRSVPAERASIDRKSTRLNSSH